MFYNNQLQSLAADIRFVASDLREISSRNWHFMRFLENLLLSKITQWNKINLKSNMKCHQLAHRWNIYGGKKHIFLQQVWLFWWRDVKLCEVWTVSMSVVAFSPLLSTPSSWSVWQSHLTVRLWIIEKISGQHNTSPTIFSLHSILIPPLSLSLSLSLIQHHPQLDRLQTASQLTIH